MSWCKALTEVSNPSSARADVAGGAAIANLLPIRLPLAIEGKTSVLELHRKACIGELVKLRLPSISYIVARSWPDCIIGHHNRLPWHLSSDLKRFRSITIGHVLIMGRKTFESIGKPLADRVSIVVSKNSRQNICNSFWNITETSVILVENRESALFYADIFTMSKQKSELFIIGGEHTFQLFRDLFNKIYITEVFTGKRVDGDSFFEYKFDGRQWKTIYQEEVPSSNKDDYPSRYCVMERRMQTVRYIDLPEYYTDAAVKQEWLHQQLNVLKKKDLNKLENAIDHYQYHLELEPLQSRT